MTLSYQELTQVSVAELFDKMKGMPSAERIDLASTYAFAKSIAEKENDLNHEARLEYLKEFGRNERAVLKGEGGGNSDDDEPLFTKP